MKNRKIIIAIFMLIFAMNVFGMNNIVQAAGKTQGICLGIYNQELWIAEGIPRSSNDTVKVIDLADENTDFLEKVYFSPNKKNLCFFQEIIDDEGTLYEVNLDTVQNGSAKIEDCAMKIDSDVRLDNIYVCDDGTVLYTKEEDDGIEKKICYFDGKSASVMAIEVESFKVFDNEVIYSVETSSSEEKLDEYITGEDLYVVEKDDLNSTRMLISNIYNYYVYDMEHIFYSKITKSMREFMGDEGDPIYDLYVLDCSSGKETKIGENVQTNSRDTLFKYNRLLWTEDDGQDTYLDEFIEDDVQTSESEQYMQSLKTTRYFGKPVMMYSYDCITDKVVRIADNVRNEPLEISESDGNWALMFWKEHGVKIKLSDVVKTSQEHEFSIEYAAKFLLMINSPDWNKLYISFNGKEPRNIDVDIAEADEYIDVEEFDFDSKQNTVSLKVEGTDINSLQETEVRIYTALIQGGKIGNFAKTDVTEQEDYSAIEYDSQIFMNSAVCGAGTVRLPNGNKIEKEHNDDSYVGTLKLIKPTGETNIISDSMKYWCLFENGNIIYTDNNMLCFWDGKKSVDLGVHAECFVYCTMSA